MKKLKIFLNGLLKENPVLVLVLGTCPTLAMSVSVINAIAMGLAAAAVLRTYSYDCQRHRVL